MKKLLYIVMIVLLGGVNNTVSAGVESEGSVKSVEPRDVKIDFGTRSSWIDGDCRRDKGLCLHIEITIDTDGNAPLGNNGLGTINVLSENRIKLNIIKDNGGEVDNENIFNVYRDIELSDEVAEAIGFKRCVIKRGQYKLSYDEYENGSVILNVYSE